MNVADFDFELPKERVARYPLADRTASRLLCLDKATGGIHHRRFQELPELLTSEDLLVFNDTRVMPARWFGQKASGGRIEVLVERLIDEHQFLAHIRASKSPRPGSDLLLEKDILVHVIERQGDLYRLACQDGRSVPTLLASYGHMPLPPYMERADEGLDQDRYQTVYARQIGAVAAPTAGLHFDESLLSVLRQRVDTTFLTLHVGAGTFQPVRVATVAEHTMHTEFLQVSEEVCAMVRATKARGGRVIAVGTTCVRALETATAEGDIKPYQGDTQIFIYPGYVFRCVDAMITNFHLPKSTLLMLVSAFGGHSAIMSAYQQAIAHHYRFYSYGDAMWIS